MKIRLIRTVEVQKFKAILDLGLKEKRTDIIAILKIANSHGDRLSEDIICKEFIFRENKVMASRILKRCRELRLIDDNFRLTKDGVQAREEDMVYRPYTGAYHVWATKDPLFPQKIIKLDIADEKIKLKDEIKGNYQSDSQAKKIDDLPEYLGDVTGLLEICLFDAEKSRVRIESIEKKIEPLPESVPLEVELMVDENKTVIETRGLCQDTRQISTFPDFKAVWRCIAGNRYDDWSQVDQSFRIDFSALDEEGKVSFLKEFKFQKTSIPDFGEFSIVPFEKFKIKPKTQEDANAWANWLLENQIKEYVFPNSYKRYCSEIKKLFLDFDITFQSRIELVEKFKKQMQKEELSPDFWFVEAPEDLVPFYD